MALASDSLLLDIVGVLTALAVILYGYIKWSFQHWKRRGVPYLEPKVPYGNFMNPFTQTMSPGNQMRALYGQAKAKGAKYCGIFTMATPNLVILDLDLLKHVLTKDFTHFIDRGFYYNEKDDPLSAHLFALGGTRWKNLRAKLTPTFTSGKMKMMFQTVVDIGNILEKHLNENVSSTEPVDIKDLLGRFATDVIGSCAFGLECNSFNEPNSPFRIHGKRVFKQTTPEALKQLFSQAFPTLGRAFGLTFFPKDVTTFYSKVVDDVVTYREKNNVVRKDFMQLLIDLKNRKEEHDGLEGETRLTMTELTAQSLLFFLAGFETSATTMTFTLYELASHPEVQDKVRAEIKTVLAKHNNQVTYDALNELKYMRQVIDETLRKYAPVPFITRLCVKDYKVPGENLVIEKDTTIIIPIDGIHYDEEYYENPYNYNPERFSEENKKNRHPYAHIPFGEGPRVCIGERFGILQTKVGLTSVLKNHRVKVHERSQGPLKMAIHSFVPSTEGDIWLTFDKV